MLSADLFSHLLLNAKEISKQPECNQSTIEPNECTRAEE